MKFINVLYIAALHLAYSSTFAGTMGPIGPQKSWRWVGTVSGGPVWSRGGETQTFYLAPEIEKTYSARKESNVFASGELFIGIEKKLSQSWVSDIGIAAATTGNARLQGVIWDDADPQFNNYSYQYKIRNTRLAVKGKLLLDKGFWLMPWVSASAGVGFNRAHEFTNTPLIFEAIPNANFTDHTKTAFTYTVGAGFQKKLNDHWQAGIGYEFADWGKNNLSRAAGQTLNSGLHLNHLYTNGLLFNLTYLG
jgi:opacity protein-like surface antigen